MEWSWSVLFVEAFLMAGSSASWPWAAAARMRVEVLSFGSDRGC